jgi:hypothetical protein
MIDLSRLTAQDVLRAVWYVPQVGPPELGLISSWNTRYIFVHYKMRHDPHLFQATSKATKPEDLAWETQTLVRPCPYCHNQPDNTCRHCNGVGATI